MPTTLLVVGLSYGVLAQGAFHAHQFRVLMGVVGAGLIAALLTRRPSLSDLGQPAVMTCIALAASALLSGWVAGAPKASLPTVALVAGLASVLVIVGRSDAEERQFLLTALVMVGVVTALCGWVGVVFRREPLGLVEQGLWRASSTITYANGTAGFLLLPAMASLALAIARPRVVWRLASYVLVLGICATLSRSGTSALVLGWVVLGRLCGPRRSVQRLWPVAVGASIALFGLLPSLPAKLPSHPWLAGSALAAGTLVAAYGIAWRGRTSSLVLTLVAVVSVFWVRPFIQAVPDASRARLTASFETRAPAWTGALRVFTQHPVIGVGPGQLILRYRSDIGTLVQARYAHNEFLQWLAEQGLVGCAALFTGSLWTVRNAWRLTPSLDRWTRRGLVVGLMSVGLCSATDFLWHIPVIPLAATIVIGLATGEVRHYPAALADGGNLT